MSKSRIYIVDDEENLLEILDFNLSKEGFKVSSFKNGFELINTLVNEKDNLPDLIVLDVLMDKMNGFETCKKIRETNNLKNIPIIFLTAKSDEVDKVLGLEIGGDDYLTKPFSIKELVSRVKAILRRTQKPSDEENISKKDILTFKNIELNLKMYTFKVDNKPVKLTKTELLIVKLFLENIGKIFSRDEIMNNIWEDSYVNDRTVDVHIRRLRKKIGDEHGIIHTYSGFGYGILDKD